jgi:hypothetical protein
MKESYLIYNQSGGVVFEKPIRFLISMAEEERISYLGDVTVKNEYYKTIRVINSLNRNVSSVVPALCKALVIDRFADAEPSVLVNYEFVKNADQIEEQWNICTDNLGQLEDVCELVDAVYDEDYQKLKQFLTLCNPYLEFFQGSNRLIIIALLLAYAEQFEIEADEEKINELLVIRDIEYYNEFRRTIIAIITELHMRFETRIANRLDSALEFIQNNIQRVEVNEN